jgi:hypothetical protein
VLVIGKRLRLLGRWRIRVGKLVHSISVMMMVAIAVVMVAVIVTSRSRFEVNMRTVIMPGKPTAPVRMAKRR